MCELRTPGSMDDELRQQALLYAAGEMEPGAAADFEDRLGNDADAQKALVQAVQLAALLDGREYAPDPAYRAAVRECAFAARADSRRRRRWIAASLASAAAIAIAIGVVWHRESNQGMLPGKSIAVVQTDAIAPACEAQPTQPEPIALMPKSMPNEPDAKAHPDFEDALNAAETWAQLSNSERLRKVLEYELRRRLRISLPVEDFRIKKQPPPTELFE